MRRHQGSRRHRLPLGPLRHRGVPRTTRSGCLSCCALPPRPTTFRTPGAGIVSHRPLCGARGPGRRSAFFADNTYRRPIALGFYVRLTSTPWSSMPGFADHTHRISQETLDSPRLRDACTRYGARVQAESDERAYRGVRSNVPARGLRLGREDRLRGTTRRAARIHGELLQLMEQAEAPSARAEARLAELEACSRTAATWPSRVSRAQRVERRQLGGGFQPRMRRSTGMTSSARPGHGPTK